MSVDVDPDRSYIHEVLPVHTDASGIRLLEGEERTALLRRVDQLSAAFRDDTTYKRKFYEEAVRPVRKTSKQMSDMVQQKGLMYMLTRLHRIQLEDVKIRFYAMISR